MDSTTTATLYWRPRISASYSAGTQTTATLYVPVRSLAGLYSRGSVNVKDKKHWIPAASTPLVDKDGIATGPWRDYLRYLGEQKLGGPNAKTLPEVEGLITYSQAQALFTTLLGQALQQMVVQNAQVTQALVQVVQANPTANPTATQIPPVQLVPIDPPDPPEPRPNKDGSSP